MKRQPVYFSSAVNRIILYHLAIGAFLACNGCDKVLSNKGAADARADLAAGKLAIETSGLPAPWRTTYARLLRERHGIELRTVAGCMIGDEDLQHMKSYNSLMEAEISRRFGADLLEKTADEARRLSP